MLNNICGNTFLNCNDDLVQYITKLNEKYYTISSIFEDDKFKNLTNELKQGSKLKDMKLNENFMLYSGVMISFINTIMKVEINKKK